MSATIKVVSARKADLLFFSPLSPLSSETQEVWYSAVFASRSEKKLNFKDPTPVSATSLPGKKLRNSTLDLEISCFKSGDTKLDFVLQVRRHQGVQDKLVER